MAVKNQGTSAGQQQFSPCGRRYEGRLRHRKGKICFYVSEGDASSLFRVQGIAEAAIATVAYPAQGNAKKSPQAELVPKNVTTSGGSKDLSEKNRRNLRISKNELFHYPCVTRKLQTYTELWEYKTPVDSLEEFYAWN